MIVTTAEDMFSKFRPSDVVQNHIYIYQIIAASYSLIQGNPDDDNRQRLTPDGRPWMTSMGFKRKVRDHIQYEHDAIRSLGAGYDIFIRGGVRFNTIIEGYHDKLVVPNRPKGAVKPKGAKGKRWVTGPEELQPVNKCLTDDFADFRFFGQVARTGDQIADNATGPLQVPHLIAFDRAALQYEGLTCRASASEEQADQNMGNFSQVMFALLPAVTFVNPRFAIQNKFTYGDLNVYLRATHQMWDTTKSNGRSGMELVSTSLFFHDRDDGKVAPRTRAPFHKVKQAVKVERLFKGEFPTSLDDYRISVDPTAVPTDAVTMAEYHGDPIFKPLQVAVG